MSQAMTFLSSTGLDRTICRQSVVCQNDRSTFLHSSGNRCSRFVSSFRHGRQGLQILRPAQTASTQDYGPLDVAPAPSQLIEAEEAARPRAVVVGAGPAGAACAISLVNQGFTVDVLERRPDPALGGSELQNTFIMALTRRSVVPLQLLGVHLPVSDWLGELAPSLGTVLHKPDGDITLRAQPAGHFSAERSILAAHLVAEARRLHPQDIRWHFDIQTEAIDLASQTVTVAGGDVLPYSLLVGADGASSVVRNAMTTQMRDMKSHRTVSDTTFNIIRDLPHAEVDVIDDRQPCVGRYVHMFVPKFGNDFLLGFGAYINKQGQYSGALQYKKSPDGTQLPTDLEAYQQMIRDGLPSVPEEWVSTIAQQSMGVDRRSWGSTIQCSHLSGPAVVLLGDAGHGVTANLGQGCNAALESVGILNKVLEVHKGNLALALTEYDEARRPEMHALAHMDLIAPEMMGQTAGRLPNIHYLITLCHFAISGGLHKINPELFGPPVMLSFGLGTSSYQTIVFNRNRDFAIALTLAVGLIAIIAEIISWLCM